MRTAARKDRGAPASNASRPRGGGAAGAGGDGGDADHNGHYVGGGGTDDAADSFPLVVTMVPLMLVVDWLENL